MLVFTHLNLLRERKNKMSKKLKIGKVILSEKTCTLVAEAGVNHNGSLKIAG